MAAEVMSAKHKPMTLLCALTKKVLPISPQLPQATFPVSSHIGIYMTRVVFFLTFFSIPQKKGARQRRVSLHL